MKVGSLDIGDPDDPVIYAGIAIGDWQRTDEARRLTEAGLAPTLWRLGVNGYSQTVELWCEEYDPEDLAIARLSGLIG